MKKLNKFVLGVLLLAAISPSCKKELTKINTDPGRVTDASVTDLFANATIDLDETSRDNVIKRYNFMTYVQYITPEQGPSTDFNAWYCDPGKNISPDLGVSYYNEYFGGIGKSLHFIINKIDQLPAADKAKYTNLRAYCVILDTYEAWKTVDLYGAMPYSQAFNDVKFPAPAYDYDYTLYKVFDAQLKSAASTLQSNLANQVDLGKQDFFYGNFPDGERKGWLAFANTLRIKIAQRYEKRDAANFTAVLNDVKTTFTGNIIAGNDGSFGVTHTPGFFNNTDDTNAIYTIFDASFAFVEFLKSINDPRLPLLVRQNGLGANGTYYNDLLTPGTPAATTTFINDPKNKQRYYGRHAFTASEAPEYGILGGTPNGRFVTLSYGPNGLTHDVDYISVIQGRYFIKNGGIGAGNPLLHTDETVLDGNSVKMRTLWLSYGETCFMMAEIANKTGTAQFGKSQQEWYEAGVRASFDQYTRVAHDVGIVYPAITSTQIDTYLNSSAAKYDGTLARIYSQAWVHFMVQPEAAYAMWKRTGYPQLTDYRYNQVSNIGDGSGIAYIENMFDGSKNRLIPRRMQFVLGGSGSSLNISNFNSALNGLITKDASYGTRGEDTKGRIWWDMP